MTTKPHPTDAMEMPEADTQSIAIAGRNAHYIDGYEAGFQTALSQLRAERIKAYDLGRQEALEDAAKAADETHPDDWAFIGAKIRSMKHGQQ